MFYVDGNKIELWLLKTLCAMLAGWQNRHPREVPLPWLRILFDGASLGVNCGLYFGNNGPFYPSKEPVSVSIYSTETERDDERAICGLHFSLSGFILILSMVGEFKDPDGKRTLPYRPSDLAVRSGLAVNQIHFQWSGAWQGRPIFVNVQV